MIEIYERSGRKAKLEECYYRMLDVDPGNGEIRLRIGRIYYDKG